MRWERGTGERERQRHGAAGKTDLGHAAGTAGWLRHLSRQISEHGPSPLTSIFQALGAQGTHPQGLSLEDVTDGPSGLEYQEGKIFPNHIPHWGRSAGKLADPGPSGQNSWAGEHCSQGPLAGRRKPQILEGWWAEATLHTFCISICCYNRLVLTPETQQHFLAVLECLLQNERLPPGKKGLNDISHCGLA